MMRNSPNDKLTHGVSTLFVSWSLPAGITSRSCIPNKTLTPLMLFSTEPVLLFCQMPEQHIKWFSTADYYETPLYRIPSIPEHEMAEDVRSYLLCVAQGVDPGLYLSCVWDQLFLSYTRYIRSLAQGYNLSFTDTEDCIQEVWIVILGALGMYGRVPKWNCFSCWIRGLIRNQVINYTRQLSIRSKQFVSSPEDAVSPIASNPVGKLELEERRTLVRHVLADLEQQVPETSYKIAYLRWIEGRNVEEVAEQLDLTHEQVWYRQHRVKKHLARLLEIHGESRE